MLGYSFFSRNSKFLPYYLTKFNDILFFHKPILRSFSYYFHSNMDLTTNQTLKEFNHDTYKTELETNILSLSKDEKDGKIEAIFASTIFHPQGGGQPSDEGYLIIGSNRINVLSLTYDREKDIIKHKLDTSDENLLKLQDSVKLHINAEKRILYARLHSAGHLVDIAVSKLKLNLKPGKGFHFPESPYVEYEGVIEEDKNEGQDKKSKKNEGPKFTKIQELLQKTCNEIISSADKENSVISRIYKYDEARSELELPSYLPEGKDVRWVKLLKDDDGCPCGGTHLKHISEIGKMNITKIIKKGKNIRICYSLE
jgi:Ser-tRNA(Ala) deacylase AlaX